MRSGMHGCDPANTKSRTIKNSHYQKGLKTAERCIVSGQSPHWNSRQQGQLLSLLPYMLVGQRINS